MDQWSEWPYFLFNVYGFKIKDVHQMPVFKKLSIVRAQSTLVGLLYVHVNINKKFSKQNRVTLLCRINDVAHLLKHALSHIG